METFGSPGATSECGAGVGPPHGGGGGGGGGVIACSPEGTVHLGANFD